MPGRMKPTTSPCGWYWNGDKRTSADARPMPLLPPVMTATLLMSLFMMGFLSQRVVRRRRTIKTDDKASDIHTTPTAARPMLPCGGLIRLERSRVGLVRE